MNGEKAAVMLLSCFNKTRRSGDNDEFKSTISAKFIRCL